MLPANTQFAVVDVETTGLFPSMHDRIIEIAVVGLDNEGRRVREYATLVNPERDIGPTHVHGIEAADVMHAPRFADIAGDVADALCGSILVAHNTRFDSEFLESEFARVGVALPQLPTVCTLELASRANIPAVSRRLAACCTACGIEYLSPHTALTDARATAQLLFALFQSMRFTTIDQLSCCGDYLAVGCFPELSRTDVACTGTSLGQSETTLADTWDALQPGCR